MIPTLSNCNVQQCGTALEVAQASGGAKAGTNKQLISAHVLHQS